MNTKKKNNISNKNKEPKRDNINKKKEKIIPNKKNIREFLKLEDPIDIIAYENKIKSLKKILIDLYDKELCALARDDMDKYEKYKAKVGVYELTLKNEIEYKLFKEKGKVALFNVNKKMDADDFVNLIERQKCTLINPKTLSKPFSEIKLINKKRKISKHE